MKQIPDDSKTRIALRERNVLSIKALESLLKQVCADPKAFRGDEKLIRAVSSQGALAALRREESKIYPVSLNHQKSVAEEVLGGFDILDRLRKGAKSALSRNGGEGARSNTKDKTGLTERVRELEEEEASILEDLILLQKAFDTRCIQARNYAKAAGPTFVALCAKEQKELDAFLSRLNKPAGTNKVVDILKGNQRGRT